MSEELKAAQARIAELEGALSWHEEQRNDMAEIRAELAALKAQEPVGSIEIQGTGFLCAPFPAPAWAGGRQPAVGTKLYAAPVSEAKAQEPDCDRTACGDFSPGHCDNPDCSARRDRTVVAQAAKAQGVVMPERWNVPRPMWKDARQPYGNPLNHADIESAEKFNLALDEVARLNATPVQQVSVPDGWRELAKRADDFLYSLPETDGALRLRADLCSMLAAPAAPAADAGLVDMYRHLQTVTPYRFKKIQDASVTDGGDVLYFHKDRFDAALLDDMAANCAKESK